MKKDSSVVKCKLTRVWLIDLSNNKLNQLYDSFSYIGTCKDSTNEAEVISCQRGSRAKNNGISRCLKCASLILGFMLKQKNFFFYCY